jgi:hypothetical protein
MKYVRSFLAAVVGLFVISTSALDFADAVLAYSPGTGFASGFTNASVVLGAPTSGVNPFSPAFRNTQLVSLGSNGSLTVQFFTPIQNDPSHPYGLDFLIFGNSGFIITNGNFSGGGITDGSLLGNNPGATRNRRGAGAVGNRPDFRGCSVLAALSTNPKKLLISSLTVVNISH